MAKLRREKTAQWMIDLADKYHISLDTVEEFYQTLKPNRGLGTLRQRTESFFDLYFEGVANDI